MHRSGGGDKRQATGAPGGGGHAAKRPGSGVGVGAPPPPYPTAGNGPDSDELDGLIEEEARERGRQQAAARGAGGGPPPPEDEDDFDDEDGVRITAPDAAAADDAAELAAAGRNWRRPQPSPVDPSTTPLIFQQLEVDYCIMPARRDVPAPVPRAPASTSTVPLSPASLPPQQREAAVVRLFGVDDQGCSVAVFVHGFEPYFYVEKPRDWGPEDVDELRRALCERLADKARSAGVPAVSSIQTQVLTSAWGCQAPPAGAGARPFLRIAVALPSIVAPARSLLEGGTLSVAGRGGWRFPTYESNVLYALRFMIDSAMGGGAWVELPAGSYRLRTHEQPPKQEEQKGGAAAAAAAAAAASGGAAAAASAAPTITGPLVIAPSSEPPLTYCQREAHVHAASVIAHAPEGEWSRLAPLRVLSVDIECCGRKGHFPDATQDPVIQIASLVTVVGELFCVWGAGGRGVVCFSFARGRQAAGQATPEAAGLALPFLPLSSS
jgi:DNA polymerase delta subunit 1